MLRCLTTNVRCLVAFSPTHPRFGKPKDRSSNIKNAGTYLNQGISLAYETRFTKHVAEEAEIARILHEKVEAEKKAEAAKLSKKKKGKK